MTKALRHDRPGWLWMAHCETSTGTLNDLDALRDAARTLGADIVLDCVSSIGNVSVDLQGVGLRALPAADAARPADVVSGRRPHLHADLASQQPRPLERRQLGPSRRLEELEPAAVRDESEHEFSPRLRVQSAAQGPTHLTHLLASEIHIRIVMHACNLTNNARQLRDRIGAAWGRGFKIVMKVEGSIFQTPVFDNFIEMLSCSLTSV